MDNSLKSVIFVKKESLMKTYEINGKEVHVGCYLHGTSSMYGGRHNLYKIRIEALGRVVFLRYHDSVANYLRGGYPLMEDVVRRLIEDSREYASCRKMEVFAGKNGYDMDRETASDFSDCSKAYHKLRSILSPCDIDRLYEIAMEGQA